MRDAGVSPSVGRIATLYLLSILSGMATLAYEIVWARQFSLTFGGTTVAGSAVIAGFLGGMGLGAWAFHRALRRARSALRLYGLIELGIAATALLVTRLLPGLPGLFGPWAAAVPAAGLTALWFVTAFVLLLVPTALMGATFPALSVVLIRDGPSVGRHLGMLYGLNTVGAAVGALVAGLVLIERIGLSGTVWVAVVLNAAIGLASLALARGEQAAERAEPEAAPPEVTPPAADTRLATGLPPGLIVAVLVGSGFATLAYEILWFRMLTYLFGSSTYALTIMLFIFLVGLGVGPVFLRRCAGREDVALAACQLAIATLAIAAAAGITHVVGNVGLERHVSIFYQTVFDRPWWQRLLLDGAAAFAMMFPAAFFMGLSFPLASRAFLGDVRRLGRRLGGAVLLANLGSILGAIAAALVILPQLGTVGGTRLVAVCNLLLGLAVLGRAAGRRPGHLAPGGGAVAIAVLLVLLAPARIRFAGAGAGGSPGTEAELVFESEGDLATVQVWRDRGDPERMGMAIDGTNIGATASWNEVTWGKQVLIAHLPLTLETRIRSVLTIGLGSASTVAALAAHDAIRHLDAVEINEPVVRAARLFPDAHALDDPRVTVHVDDAIHFLLRTERRYDLIVSDGKQAMSFRGNAKLLSPEFYESCLDRLAEDGLFVQWAPLAIGTTDFRIIARTISASFPHLEVFYFRPSHLVFVGAKRPLGNRPRPSEEAFAAGPAAVDLATLGIASVEELLGRWTTSGQPLAAVAGTGPRNSWDRPVLEFTAYKQNPARWQEDSQEILELLAEARARAAPAPER